MFLFVVHSFSSQQAHLLPKYPIVFHLPSFPDLSLGPALFLVAAAASVVSNSVRPHRWQPTRLPRPWDSPGKNTGVGCHFLLQCMKVKSESEFAQLCPTLSDPMDWSLPGSSIHGIFQARVLEWGAITYVTKYLWQNKVTFKHVVTIKY